MADKSNKILEGVFAINKPPQLSSAQVLRDLQVKFRDSQTFAPLLEKSLEDKSLESRYGRKRRQTHDPDSPFKMGHGGTLDPLATGVLIVGLGRGTKHLNNFIGSTKTYETVVLFGKSTDTYDVAGKAVATKDASHITKEQVEQMLEKFRGDIQQMPPVYSALKIQGMKAYEYARSGKELPRQLESRPMKVDECAMLEWYPPGTHDFRWPAAEGSAEEKEVAFKFLANAGITDDVTDAQSTPVAIEDAHPQQRLAEDLDGSVKAGNAHEPQNDNPATVAFNPPLPTLPIESEEKGAYPPAQDAVQPDKEHSPSSPKDDTLKRKSWKEHNTLDTSVKASLHTHVLPEQESIPADAPAARIRLTVSSGFYVRSFAHDLGIACQSYGIMATLIRCRQGNFTTESPPTQGQESVLTYEELEKGEEVWGAKISKVLEKWMEDHPDTPREEDGSSRRDKYRDHGWQRRGGGGNEGGRWGGRRDNSARSGGGGNRHDNRKRQRDD